MDTWRIVVSGTLLVACMLYGVGPSKDGSWKQPGRRIARHARRVPKMMRKALPGLLVGAVFGLAAAGSDMRTVVFAGLLVWVGGSVFVDTMSRPFGRRPRVDAILLGLSISAVGMLAFF